MFQNTIRYPASCYGIGVHSGRTVQLTLKPAKAGDGITFVRTDIIGEHRHLKASFDNVTETSYSTSISDPYKKFSISTIEHLMAAIWGAGIDNIIVELDGPEVPIMDGSSRPFVFMLECAQVKQLSSKKRYLKINREVFVDNCKGGQNILSPSNSFQIDIDIEFESKVIGKQSFNYNNRELFGSDVASARTFGFIHELEYMQNLGLARGASLNNAIGLDKDVILNHDGLRYEDEFVRHKLLDAIGDFALASIDVVGSFSCIRPGHELNNLLLRKLFDDPQNYCFLSKGEL